MKALNPPQRSPQPQTRLGRWLLLWRARVWAGLAVLALIVIETTGVSLWYQAVFEPPGSTWPRIFAILFLVSFASYLLVRALEALGWRMLLRQVVFAAWLVVMVFASLKLLRYPTARLSLVELFWLPLRYIVSGDGGEADFFHMIGMVLWVWRGVALARSPISMGRAQGSFQMGLVALLLYGMIYAPVYPVEATVGLYLYLFAGLVGMSMARIANLSELRGGRVPRFGLGWTLSILFAGLLVVALAILTGWLSSGRVMEILAQIVLVIIAILTALVLLILSPLLMWLANLLPLLAELLDQLMARLRNLPISNQVIELMEAINEGIEKMIPFLMAGRGLMLALILLLITAGVLLALYLRSLGRKLVQEEESESSEPGATGNILRKIIQRLFGRGRGLKLRRAGQVLAAARIRQIYRNLMLLSARLGAERPASVTPLEFLPRLETIFPEEQAGLGLITGTYVKIRYGAYPETREEVEEVVQAWNRVRKQGRRALSARRQQKKT